MLLIGKIIKPLAKSVLIPLTALTGPVSAPDAVIHKKMFGSAHPLDLASRTTTLIISNEEINDTIRTIKSLESGLIIKGISDKIKNETKEQKGRFLSMLLDTLGASLLGNLLTGKGAIATSQG